MIALGDSSYVNFCNGGKQFDALLQEQNAQRVGEMLLIDATENPEPETESNPWVEHWGRCCPDLLSCPAIRKCRFSGAESSLFRQTPVKTAY